MSSSRLLIGASTTTLLALTLGSIAACASPVGALDAAAEQSVTAAATPADGIRSASLSWADTCVVTRLGAAKCWGSDYDGQLGNGAQGDNTDSFHPVDVRGLGADVAKISAGGSYACAVTVHGAVKCWGLNTNGQLGTGSTNLPNANVPTDVVSLDSGVTELATGDDHACALTSAGAVKCWGANDLGQLGTDSVPSSTTPVDVQGLGDRATAIASTGSHSCALLRSGGVKCWGAGSRGQLGNGATADSATPVAVTGLASGVKAIATGLEHSCAVTDRDGAVHCWGRNDFGQLGNGTTTDSAVPEVVAGLAAPVGLLASGGYHNCVVTLGGAARCWGLASTGQLGNGSSAAQMSGPVDVQGLSTQVTSIALGLYHSCATTGAGALSCWGFNGSAGALGIDGATTSSPVPVAVWP